LASLRPRPAARSSADPPPPAAAPAYVRGSDLPSSTRPRCPPASTRRDLERLFDQNIKSLLSSGRCALEGRLAKDGKDVTGRHLPRQERDQRAHRRPAQRAALQVRNRARQQRLRHGHQPRAPDALVEELQAYQQSAAFDPDKAAQLGRQLGAQYFVTGKIYDSAEKSGGERRVQYFFFMQAIDVETGAVRWQNEANLTKGLIK
jgi:hypothetical protein